MRVPFRSEQADYLEPARSPLIPLSCLLAIAVAIAVLGAEFGGRLAIMAAVFAAVGLSTRVPRALPVLAAVTLAVAGFAVLDGGQAAPALASHLPHAIAHAHRVGK